jgi:hypothetical protein
MEDGVNLLLMFSSESLLIRPWPDGVIDALGFDPRSAYVETYWLGILGPSTTWLLRRLVAGLDISPEGFDLPLAETARQLGLGDRGGRHSPFLRAIARTMQFELAQPEGDAVLAVRRRVPPLSRRQVLRLSPALQEAHARWQEAQLRVPTGDEQRRRSRRLALSLVELGEDVGSAERQLLRWSYHPVLAREAASWAWDRHRSALAAAGGTGGSSRPSLVP